MLLFVFYRVNNRYICHIKYNSYVIILYIGIIDKTISIDYNFCFKSCRFCVAGLRKLMNLRPFPHVAFYVNSKAAKPFKALAGLRF